MKEPKILKLYGKNVGKSWRQGGREDLKSYAPFYHQLSLRGKICLSICHTVGCIISLMARKHLNLEPTNTLRLENQLGF